MRKEIRRGEIYWVDWNQGRGSEQAGIRPALIIQNDIGNKFGATTIIAALSTATDKPFPFIVKVTSEESGLQKDSIVNLAVIMTVDKTHLNEKCGELSQPKMAEVDDAIKVSLGLL